MKYAIIIPDGCADEAQESLGGKTPLEAANVPSMDVVAAAGVVGRSCNVPVSLPPGSDVANLSLLGYNPLENFKVLYGTGHFRLDDDGQPARVGGVRYTIKDGIVYDARELLSDVREMVQEARKADGAGPQLKRLPNVPD